MKRVSQFFQLSAMCVAVFAVTSSTAFALEKLDEEDLAESTGEGIAFLPTDFSLRFNGANEIGKVDADITDNSNPGTGYIHIIPVGPLSETIQNENATANNKTGKADVYIYGLALSKNDEDDDNNLNKQFSGKNIASWGTAENPWIVKVATASGIPNFDINNTTGSDVSYMRLEAPLYEGVVTATTGTTTTQPTKPSSANGGDAYNMKLGMWVDAFVRDPSVVEGQPDQFCLNGCTRGAGDLTRENRIRLQAIWNGMGVNGSSLNVFSTLGGATDDAYNNTLGLAGLIRLNSNENGVLRLSTQETTLSPNASKLLTTPAIDGVAAPIFAADEGISLEKFNVNLALGSLYQPVILDATDDGNIVFEVTRIPNKPSIYQQIYTDYANPNSTTFKGVTCSQFYCGGDGSSNVYQTAGTVGGSTYRNPTHSSITVGDVSFNNATRTIEASTAGNTKGIVFNGAGGPVNLGSAVIDGVLIQHLKITTKGL